jgi:hypothetical protein
MAHPCTEFKLSLKHWHNSIGHGERRDYDEGLQASA